MNAPYTYKSYREFISARLETDDFGRGSRKKLAEFLGVQKSFVSLVLSGKFDFTPEHVFKLSNFLRLDEEDRDCLLLMINRDRAGSNELKNFYADQIKKIRTERETVSSQVRAESSLSESEYSLYASKWFYIAIHMCLRNPHLREINKIAKYLRLSFEEVSKALKVLERLGFAENIKGEWHSKVARYNANKESPGLRTMHTNCRHLAIQSLDSPDQKDMHYSLVLSIDKNAVEIFRKKILELVKSFEPVIEKAADDQVVAFSLDLFKVGSH